MGMTVITGDGDGVTRGSCVVGRGTTIAQSAAQ